MTRNPFRRPNITGNAANATDLLARAVLVRLDRGWTHRAARDWALAPRQLDRYGDLAGLAVATLLPKDGAK